ncbi:MAG: hypothetical protein PHU94_03445 [Bacilli bacterium]|nr:hypothetical protein [Bacilli bacterium]MDD4734125.1 hypothetical protein [Bacilli bacterium]
MKQNDCKCIPDIVNAPDVIDKKSYDEYIENLYKIFVEDFIDKGVFFLKKKVYLDFNTIVDNKSETFFHVICGDKKDITNFRRAERIKYPKSIIENYLECETCMNNCKIKMFFKKIHGKKRYHFFSEEYLYMVVLEDEGKKMKLITAFYIDEKYKIYNYNNDYKNYINSQNKDDAIN